MAPSGRRRLVLGIDTGGTFTDLAAVDLTGRSVATVKVPSTPDDPSEAIEAAIRACLDAAYASAGDIAAVIHGTTIATNALLERRGVRTALVVNRGFRDLLLIGRQHRPDLYDGRIRRPAIVPRSRTFEINARMRHDGSLETPLDTGEVRRLACRLARAGVQSVAICLLHSHRDPSLERAVAACLAEEAPELPVTESAALVPLIGEVERATTATVNAYVGPIVDRYLERLVVRLARFGIRAPVYVMQSNGGLASTAAIHGRSVQTVLSGPAAGVVAGRQAGGFSTRRHLVTVDMGGTSFDISFLPNRRVSLTTESDVGGWAVTLPAIDIHTLGAGGGSVAWLDDGGALRVGPASAGAKPGPAAYGRGGQRATVTDANVVLGRLPGPLLGGALPLDLTAARAAVQHDVADRLGCSIEEAALGILAVINAEMVRGIRRMSVARGWDPRELSLVAFGGAGPLHAVELARALGIGEVVIPPAPGATSAKGLLGSTIRREFMASVMLPAPQLTDTELAGRFAELDQAATAYLSSEGIAKSGRRFEHRARVAYRGQGYDLEIDADGRMEGLIAHTLGRFRRAHLRRFGFVRADPVVVVSIASTAVGLPVHRAPRPVATPQPLARPTRRTKIVFASTLQDAIVLRRSGIGSGQRIDGPALVEQLDTTTFLPPGSSAVAVADGTLVVTVGRDAERVA